MVVVQLGRFTALTLVVALFVWPAATESRRSSNRPATFDDLYADVEDVPVDQVSFSPDGIILAFTRQRPRSTLPAGTSFLMDYYMRGDIWLHEPGRPAKPLTSGHSDGSGAWSPRWSPDGKRLAFLSSTGREVTVWVWDRDTRALRQVAPQGVADSPYEFTWVDSRRLVWIAPPENETYPPLSETGRTVEHAEAVWSKASKGELTASVLDSRLFNYPQRRLILVDAVNGMVRVIAPTTNRLWGMPKSLWVSPNGKAIAVLQPVPTEYGAATLSSMGFPRSIELRPIDQIRPSFDQKLPGNIITASLAWSPDGKELAFFALGDRRVSPIALFGVSAAEAIATDPADALVSPVQLWRVSLEANTVEQVETGELDVSPLIPPTFTWTGSGELLFRAARRRVEGANSSVSRNAGINPSLEWWILDRTGHTRPLTTTLSKPPLSLLSIDNGAALIGVSDGELWRIESASGKATNLTEDFAPRIAHIHRIYGSALDGTNARILISTGRVETTDVRFLESANPTVQRLVPLRDMYEFDIASRHAVLQERPTSTAVPVGYHPVSRSTIYFSDDSSGTHLWRRTGAAQIEHVVSLNTFRQDIIKCEARLIEFVSHHGKVLRAALSLPLGYVQGRRYPLVVQVYQGLGASALLDDVDRNSPPTYGDTFGAAGYLFMKLEMPNNLPGLAQEEGDSILMLSSSVLPAAERAIALGLADPDRLFVMGGSKGAWSTVGLLTQTTRFKAAAAWNGAYNEHTVFTGVGSLPRSIVLRHTQNPHERAIPQANSRSYSPTDVPWWRDRERSRRNSPLSYVERIQTPILIIHGDLDRVPIEQSEDLFNALVSMRKTAQFVRYWGESHGNSIIANYRDMWQRIFAWFDQYGDIKRNSNGSMVFDGDRVSSRHGSTPLAPESYSRFSANVSAPVH